MGNLTKKLEELIGSVLSLSLSQTLDYLCLDLITIFMPS